MCVLPLGSTHCLYVSGFQVFVFYVRRKEYGQAHIWYLPSGYCMLFLIIVLNLCD